MRNLRVRRALTGAVVLVSLVSATACGSDVDGSGEDTSGETPTPTASASDDPSDDEPAADPEARKALRSGFMRLARANTGRFEVTVPLASDYVIEEKGRYQLSPVAYTVVRELRSPEGNLQLEYRGVDGIMWVRMVSMTRANGESQSWPCWVNYDDIASFKGFPAELAQGPTDQPPAAVVAASYGVGTRAVDDMFIEGTMDLALAMGLVSGKLVVASGIDAQADNTVPATFLLDQGTLSGFRVRLADFPDAIEQAGGSNTQEIESLASLTAAITARFFDVGAPVEVQEPPANEQLTVKSAEDFETAMSSCGKS